MDLTKRINSLENLVDELQDEKMELRVDIDSKNREIRGLSKIIRRLEKENSELRGQIK